jgi:hypothetical protein
MKIFATSDSWSSLLPRHDVIVIIAAYAPRQQEVLRYKMLVGWCQNGCFSAQRVFENLGRCQAARVCKNLHSTTLKPEPFGQGPRLASWRSEREF